MFYLLIINVLPIFKETFSDPFETVPAADEDQATDVLVEGEDGPHCDETPAEGDAKDIASYDLYAPHHDDAYEDREIDVTGTAEGIDSEEIERTSVFKQHLDPKDCRTGGDDPRV